MSPLDAVWHLLNFFAPAVVIGTLSAYAARVLWRGELRSTGWRRLFGWAVLPPALVAVVALVLTGRDGRMLTYLAMVAACAAGLWWGCFVRFRRG